MRRLFFPAIAALLIVRPVMSQTPVATAPAIDFSGLMFGSYAVRIDSQAKASFGGKAPNQFGIDRVYLTFRMPAGDNGQIRVTTDVFQNADAATNAYYQGWTIRLKYAYFQYTGLKDVFGAGSSATGRVGSLHNVIIDQAEAFWPRFLQQTAVERTGFFASADVGVAGLLTLPSKWGEVYGTITNGGGYTTFDRDRFKDYAARVSLTPFAGSTDANGFLKSMVVVPWFYKGTNGSGFASGGPGQVGPGTNGAITEGLTRNRYGIFAGAKVRRLAVGVDFAQRVDESETGANTVAAPRAVADSTGRLIDGYILARPIEWINASKRSPLSLIARYDWFTPNTDPTSANYAGTTPAYGFLLLGAIYDVNQRINLALDWQTNTPLGFPAATGTNVRPTSKQSTVFLHWQATF